MLTGPESLTQAEQVRIIGAAIGRPIRFEERWAVDHADAFPRGLAT